MTIREKVAQALSDTRDDRPEPGQLYNHLATVAIDTFLAAAAKEGWRIVPDEVTDEMINAGVGARAAFFKKTGFSDCGPRIVLVANHPAGTIYQAMLAAAPKFEWDK